MEIKGKFTFACNRCGKSYDYTSEDVNFKPEENNGEILYIWEKKFNCVKCGNPISIRYEISTTPEGKIIDKNVQVDGAKVISDSLEFIL